MATLRTRPTPRQRAGRVLRRVFIAGSVLGALALIVLAWQWQQTLPLRSIDVSGAVRADSAEIVRLAAVEADTTVFLYSLDPTLIADRVRRAPWVRDGRVRRLPSGTLAIRVEEREPRALVIGANGKPSHYLDRDGYSLPLRPGDPWDVPLLRGRVPAYHPTRPVERPALRELLAALADARPEVHALVSEVHLGTDGDVVIRTSPAGNRGDVAVRMGTAEYDEKLRRLQAFWHEGVLSRPHVHIRVVDLRFDGQIVTQESPRPQLSAASP